MNRKPRDPSKKEIEMPFKRRWKETRHNLSIFEVARDLIEKFRDLDPGDGLELEVTKTSSVAEDFLLESDEPIPCGSRGLAEAIRRAYSPNSGAKAEPPSEDVCEVVPEPKSDRDLRAAARAAFEADARFRNMLLKVKSWEGCAPINLGKETDPTLLYAVDLGVIEMHDELVGPLRILSGQKAIKLTDLGWDLVGGRGGDEQPV